MGIDEPTFWTLNPRRMKAYERAFELKQQQRDREQWAMGQYFMSALSTVLDHAFNKHATSKYVKEPFLTDAFLTEEEIKQKQIAEVQKTFSFLEGLQGKFDKREKG